VVKIGGLLSAAIISKKNTGKDLRISLTELSSLLWILLLMNNIAEAIEKFKVTLFSLIYCLLIFVTTYLSMRTFQDQPAASCLDCSYLRDTFFFSLFSLAVIPFVLWILNRLKMNGTLSSLIISVVFLANATLNNLNLFIDRVSSWSSYSTTDEILASIAQSYGFTLTGGAITFLIFWKKYFLIEKRLK